MPVNFLRTTNDFNPRHSVELPRDGKRVYNIQDLDNLYSDARKHMELFQRIKSKQLFDQVNQAFQKANRYDLSGGASP